MAVELQQRGTIQDLAEEKNDGRAAISASREPRARQISSTTDTTSLASLPTPSLPEKKKGDDGRAIETAKTARHASKPQVSAGDLDLDPGSDSSSCFSYEDGVDDFDGPLWWDATSAESVAREAGLISGSANLAPQDSNRPREGLTKQATQQHEVFDMSSSRSVASCQRAGEVVTKRESDGKQRRSRDRSIDAIVRSSSITENIPYPGDDLVVQAHNIDHTPHKCSPLCGGRYVGQCAHVAGCHHGPYSFA